MRYYIESPSNDPHFNLALEQYVFDKLSPSNEYLMLWRNDNAIIVGKHQNTAEEINAAYVREHGIRVVRRLSGGGAVYHDLGNINFTFIQNAGKEGAFDFAFFCRPVVDALASLGVKAELQGRNDMTIDGQKFSGNAQYVKRGRVMHHGTILYDSDLSVLSKALNVRGDKIESKGIKSVRSRVTNIKPHMPEQVEVDAFFVALRDFLFQTNHMAPYNLTWADTREVRRLQQERYDQWEWNYGASPAYSIRKERRVEGCGTVEVHMEVEHGVITACAFTGDYFAREESGDLARRLTGCRLEEEALADVLAALVVDHYFQGMQSRELLDILTQ